MVTIPYLPTTLGSSDCRLPCGGHVLLQLLQRRSTPVTGATGRSSPGSSARLLRRRLPVSGVEGEGDAAVGALRQRDQNRESDSFWIAST